MRNRIVVLLVAVLCTVSVVPPAAAASSGALAGDTVTVTDVVDGDTIDVRYADGTRDTVRLLGVDTPEVYGETDPAEFEGIPDTPEGHQWLRSYGEAASDHATDRLAGEQVRIEPDANQPNRGSFDRLLRYVYLDGDLFNRALLDRGLARVYDSDFTMRTEFESVERDARTADRGLWAFGQQQQQSGGVTHGLTVDRVHADAAGTERDNLDDEYVVFRNVLTEPLDLTGWQVWEGDDNVYTFPNGYTLGPDESVTLYTGDGPNTQSSLYWGQDAPVWNNNGDAIVVRNAAGGAVLSTSYESNDRLNTCRSPASFGGSSPPLDLDCDGRYEDVDGNGEFTYNDLVTLFENFGGSMVRDTVTAFDFNGNGMSDFDDLVVLFESL